MSLIGEQRHKLGLSQAQLAKRLNVSPPAIAQWEASEDRGTIQLNTLTKALAAMNTTLTTHAVHTHTLRTLSIITPVHLPTPLPQKQTILDASYAGRIPAIVGEAWNSHINLSVEQLWVVADRITVATTLTTLNQARAIRDSYDALQKEIRTDRFIPYLATPDGRTIPPPKQQTPTPIINWAALAILNETPWLNAYRMAAALLVKQGHPWPILPCTSTFQHAWNNAINHLTTIGDATGFSHLITLSIRNNHVG